MGKSEVTRSQLESIMNEMPTEGEDKNVPLGEKQRSANGSRSLFRLVIKLWGIRIFVFTMIIVLVIAGAFWLLSGNLVKKESTSFVEQVQELATLATAEAYVKVIIEQEDNKLFGKDISLDLPGTKRELFLVVPATIIAGVDLKGISSDDIKVDDKNKKLEIKLPHAAFIQEPAIQMEKVRTFSDEGIFRGEVEWDEGFDLADEAQELIKKEATEIGLLQTAEKSAEKVLKEFFRHLGYSVKLTFK